ncbi:hypothetical protein [Streptomyces sp. NPDC007905]|uniref:hypothetical protein n=1 Tax=Streptomyces sp. NPDC007905 TaxID=3364788 RepID=UPI0036F04565
MTPIRAQDQQADRAATAEQGPHAAARGRHRKPRPRKILLAAGGLALVAGVLSLVRVAPETRVGAPGTAEAEPRLDPTGDVTDSSAAPQGSDPTAPPSATSVMGGVSAAPTTGRATPTPSATPTSLPGSTGVPTTIPTGTPRPTSTPTTTGPRPATTTPTPARTPTPTPSHSTTAPAPGGEACVPVIGLCVDLPGVARR